MVFLMVYGVPPNPAQRAFLQTISILLSVSFAFLIGLSFLLMLCSELLTLVKDESERDLLCGVLNRRGIEQKLDVALKRTGRGQNLSIALIDIDHFKAINDYAGHAAGDTALRDVVAAISRRLHPHDLLGRFGGDEFLLILPHTSSPEALAICSRIEQSVRELSIPGGGLPLTISIGLTQPPTTKPQVQSSPVPTRPSTTLKTTAETAAASSSTSRNPQRASTASFPSNPSANFL